MRLTVTKKIILGVVLVLIALIGYRYSQIDAVNARVSQEIRDQPDGERALKSMIVTLQDGRVYPVNYLWEGDFVYMGIDGRWWREFTGDGQPVEMFVRGENYTGHAIAVLDDPERKADIFSRLRPTAPSWLPDFLNGKLVVIALDEPDLP